MRPHGELYRKGRSKLRGQLLIHLPFRIRLVYHSLRFIGLILLGVSFAGIFITYGSVIFVEAKYEVSQPQAISPKLTMPVSKNSPEEDTIHEAQTLNLDPSFSIDIPKIDAKSNVIANVDATNEDEYLAALKKGVAHAKGSSFPGQGKLIFLFAHSTNTPLNAIRYNAVFYLLSKLTATDEIVLFYQDKKYVYSVVTSEVKGDDDMSLLVERNQGEELVLMTCTPPGTSWKRLFVIARLKTS